MLCSIDYICDRLLASTIKTNKIITLIAELLIDSKTQYKTDKTQDILDKRDEDTFTDPRHEPIVQNLSEKLIQ